MPSSAPSPSSASRTSSSSEPDSAQPNQIRAFSARRARISRSEPDSAQPNQIRAFSASVAPTVHAYDVWSMSSLEIIWHRRGGLRLYAGRRRRLHRRRSAAGEPGDVDVLDRHRRPAAAGSERGRVRRLAAGARARRQRERPARHPSTSPSARSPKGSSIPQLTHGGGDWYAFWGATLDARSRSARADRGGAAAGRRAEYFHGDRDATVDDLYPRLVDQIARDRLRRAGVRLVDASASDARARSSSSSTASLRPSPSCPPAPTTRAREADHALGRRRPRPDRRGAVALGLHLDERVPRQCARAGAVAARGGRPDADAAGVDAVAGRRGAVHVPARRAIRTRTSLQRWRTLGPLLAEHGIAFDDEEPRSRRAVAEAGVAASFASLLPALEHRGVPVLLAERVGAGAERASARTSTARDRRSSGLLSTTRSRQFDWRLAVGDVGPRRGGAAPARERKARSSEIAGRWHALRHDDVTRALRFLERRARAAASSISCAGRRVSTTDEYGLELGEVALDERSRSCSTATRASSRCRRRRGCSTTLFPFQEQGHGWLRLLGDLGIGAILADDMGLGKTVQAIAMLVSEREEYGARRVRADARRLPDERRAAVGARRSSASRRACASTCITARDRLAGDGARRACARSTSWSRRTTSPRATSSRCSSSTGTGCSSTRRRT